MTPTLPLEKLAGPTRGGYLLALALFAGAITFAAFMMWRLGVAVDAMPRIEANGEHTVMLPAGDLVVFAELTSPTQTGNIRCGAEDAAGRQLKLSNPSVTETYNINGHQGRNVFDLAVPASGPVTVACEADADLTLAFSPGLGTRIVVAAGVSVSGTIAAIAVFVVTLVRRRRYKRRVREGQLAGDVPTPSLRR